MLRQVASTGAVLTTVAGGATAEEDDTSTGSTVVPDEKDEFVEKYKQQGKRQKLLQTHAKETLHELSDRDIIARPSHNVFDLNTKLEETPKAGDKVDGWTVKPSETEKGTPTAHMYVSKTTENHSIVVHILPVANKSYATVESTDEEHEFLIDPSTKGTKLTKDIQGDVGTMNSCSAHSYTTCSDRGCMIYTRGANTQYKAHWELEKTCYSIGSRCSCVTTDETCKKGTCECMTTLCV